MPYEDDYKMWLEKMLIESNPDWVCDEMHDVGFTDEWCDKHCGEDSDYVTPKCLHMYYHHIANADRKTEPQTDCPQSAICGKPCKECGACEKECGMWEILKNEPQTDCSWQKGE